MFNLFKGKRSSDLCVYRFGVQRIYRILFRFVAVAVVCFSSSSFFIEKSIAIDIGFAMDSCVRHCDCRAVDTCAPAHRTIELEYKFIHFPLNDSNVCMLCVWFVFMQWFISSLHFSPQVFRWCAIGWWSSWMHAAQLIEYIYFWSQRPKNAKCTEEMYRSNNYHGRGLGNCYCVATFQMDDYKMRGTSTFTRFMWMRMVYSAQCIRSGGEHGPEL